MLGRILGATCIFVMCVVILGCSESNDENEPTPISPNAPSNLRVLSMGSNNVAMQWTDNATDENAYFIERSPDNNQSFAQVAQLPEDSVTFNDTGLTSGAEYFYRVRAGRGADFSGYSNEVQAWAIPNVPPDSPVVVFPANGAINTTLSPTLRWLAEDTDEDTLLFDVYFDTSSTPSLVSSDQNIASLPQADLDTNTQYYWKVVAKDWYFETQSPVWTFRTGYGGPSIWVIFPNGGERLLVGSPPDITWGSDQLVGTIDILLSVDGGNNWPYIVASGVTNTGSYSWTPTEIFEPSCRLRIQSSTNPIVYDDSDENFLIYAPWYEQFNETGTFLYNLAFVDTNIGWSVGDDGAILHTTNGGHNWMAQASGTVHNLRGAAFIDSNNGWVVGGGGTILHTSNGGNTWTEQISGTMEWLSDVAFVDVYNGWVAGEGGSILHTSNGGNAWTAQTSGTLYGLSGIAPGDANNIWVVGGGGTILHTSNGGNAWTVQTSGTPVFLNDITFIDASNGWVVGRGGTILRTTNGGNTWTPQTSGTINELLGVDFININNGWIVGVDGTILQTTNGGILWAFQVSGTTNYLWDITFVDMNNGWIAGGSIFHTTTGGF